MGMKLAEFATFADYMDCRQIPASKNSFITKVLGICLFEIKTEEIICIDNEFYVFLWFQLRPALTPTHGHT